MAESPLKGPQRDHTQKNGSWRTILFRAPKGQHACSVVCGHGCSEPACGPSTALCAAVEMLADPLELTLTARNPANTKGRTEWRVSRLKTEMNG